MLLYIYGEESWLVREKLQQIVKRARSQGVDATNTAEFEGTDATVAAVQEGVQAAPFLADKRLVIIRNWLTNRIAAESDRLVEILEPEKDAATIIAVTEDGLPDKRLGAVKKLEAAASKTWRFDPVDESAAAGYVQKFATEAAATIQPGTARQLVQQVGVDLWRLHSEVGKLALKGQITPQDLAELVTPDIEGNIFALVDALGSRNLKRATIELQKLLAGDEPPLRLLAMVIRQFRLLISAKALGKQTAGKGDLAKQLGVRPFLVDKLKQQSARFTERELLDIYTELQRIDMKLKNSPPDVEALLQLFVADVCATS